MSKAELAVLICGKPAGILSQNRNGQMRFEYSPDYSGVPLSAACYRTPRDSGAQLLKRAVLARITPLRFYRSLDRTVQAQSSFALLML